ncbi:hypothetical protein [Lactiplantibacillus brownii]|uniref:hypothetical protein n=1 Tax=Lactiplantibacillus brownii TaxID=3069269 RepID=UPI0038B2B000
MPEKIETTTYDYPINRFIKEDLHSTVNQFAAKWGKNQSTINHWSGRDKDKKNLKLVTELPIWILQLMAWDANQSLDETFNKLNDYYKDWERDNRYYIIKNKLLKPIYVADYLSQLLGESYHLEGTSYNGLNSQTAWFDNFVLEINTDEGQAINEDSIIIYDPDHQIIYNAAESVLDEEATANQLMGVLKDKGLI